MRCWRYVCFAALCCAAPAFAQPPTASVSKRVLQAVKTDTPPVIDGKTDDAAWKLAGRSDGFVDSQNGALVADQTLVYTLYDSKYIYVAFLCKDSQPDKIVARETIRNYRANNNFYAISEDAVDIALDPFAAHRPEDRTVFSINALGTPSARFASGRGNKLEWQGDWQAAAVRTPEGWSAEMRIPWTALNYPNSQKPATFGINFSRTQARTATTSIWSYLGAQGFLENDGHWVDVQVPQHAFRPTLSLLPYTILGGQRSQGFIRSGLDVRYTLSPELTAVGTLNPDFGTIEGAVEGIAFSRSQRFVPERRPFFLEGSDYFSASFINIMGPLFYSLRIPTFDVGAKVYGKITPKDTIGFLGALDFGNRNDMILRYRHDLGPTSSAALFFSQKSDRTESNSVGAFTQTTRWGKFLIDTKVALTGGQGAGGGAQELNFGYQDKLAGFFVGLANVTPTYKNANGFVPFTDYKGPIAQVNWNAEWRKGFWRSFFSSITPVYWWHQDGRPFQRGVQSYLGLETRSDWRFEFGYDHMMFDGQRDATWRIGATRGVSNRFLQWGASITTGVQGDLPSTFISPMFSVRMFRKLEVSYEGSLLSLSGLTQQHIATVNYQLSPTRSLGGRIVIQNSDVNWYLSYRNANKRGAEFYVILGDPNALKFSEQLRVKFVFAI